MYDIKLPHILKRCFQVTFIIILIWHPYNSNSQSWNTYLVNTVSAKCTGIAINSSGLPHLFYYTPFLSSNSLNHSYWNGQTWAHETIGSAASFHNSGPRAIIDSINCIHVFYFNNQLKLAYAFYNGVWQTDVIDNEINTGDYMSFMLDSDNIPHVAYSKGTSNARYAKRTGNQWQIIDLPGSSTGKISLSLDSQDHPHIFYSGKYHYFDGMSWHQEIIAEIGSTSSLSLDNADQPHICYYYTGDGSYDLRYACKNSNVWTHYIVDPGHQQSKRGWYNTMSTDQNGILHISYLDHNLCQVKHAWGFGNNWNVEVIETLGNSAIWWTGNDLLCQGNNVYVSYYNQITQQIRLGTLAGDYTPPENLAAEIITSNDVFLDWDHPGNSILLPPSLFRIYSNNVLIANVPPASTEYLVADLAQGTFVFYITAMYGNNESGPSNEVVIEITSLVTADSNCDEIVNLLDVITTVNYAVGLNPKPFCFENADVNQDGIVNVLDVIETISIILGRI